MPVRNERLPAAALNQSLEKASEKDAVQVAVVQFESGKLETMVKGLAALVSA